MRWRCSRLVATVLVSLVWVNLAMTLSATTMAQPEGATPEPLVSEERAGPAGVLVLPFLDRRTPNARDWLGSFLAEALADTVLRSGRVGLVRSEAAWVWGRVLGNDPDQVPPPAVLRRLKVGDIIRGATQRVVDQARIEIQWLRVVDGAVAASETWRVTVNLAGTGPTTTLNEMLSRIWPHLGIGLPPNPPPQPATWAAWRALVEARHSEDDGALAAAQADPALRAEALEALAVRDLVAARRPGTPEETSNRLLRGAVQALAQAVKLEPWDVRRMALKGEAHYFLKEDFDARTEASVARLRNPLDGLAYLVLGLVAGLSTAEGDLWMQQALEVDPYLQEEGRPPGLGAFQNGALEPLIARWETLSQQVGGGEEVAFRNDLGRAERLIAEGNWEAAELVIAEAAELRPEDHRPRRLRARLELEVGDPTLAVEQLRVLAAEFPQEWDVWHNLGLALEVSEAYGEAQEAFQKALLEQPGQPDSMFHLAVSQIGATEWEVARITLNRLLRGHPRHGPGWLHLGIVETRLNNEAQAVHAFEQALRIDPLSEKARIGHRLAQERLQQER